MLKILRRVETEASLDTSLRKRTINWPTSVRDKRKGSRNRLGSLIHTVYERYGSLLIGLHPVRVASRASELAYYLKPLVGLTNRDIEIITVAALLHDIGKSDDEIRHYFLTGKIDYEEAGATDEFFKTLGAHTQVGMKILASLKLDDIIEEKERPSLIAAAGFHHTACNQLRDLPKGANIWAVHITSICDVFDTKTKGEGGHQYEKKVDAHMGAAILLRDADQGVLEPRATEVFITECLELKLEDLPVAPPRKIRQRRSPFEDKN